MPGTSSWTAPSGAVMRRAAVPGRIVSTTGSPGRIGSTGVDDPPSSSPVRFASRIGNATCSGRSDWRGSNVRTAVGRPSRSPAYRSGAPRGPGMTARAQSGSVIRAASATCSVDRSTKLRIGSSGLSEPMPGFGKVPLIVPSGLERSGAMARIGTSGRSAGTVPSKMIRSHASPDGAIGFCASSATVPTHGWTPGRPSMAV